MRCALTPHPGSLPGAVTSVTAEAERAPGGRLRLRFEAIGGIGDLALPALAAATRTDGLWRSTCFEAFIRPTPGESYVELNFAPSTQWAAYRFDAPRQDMRPEEGVAPRIDVEVASDRLALIADVELADGEAPWRIGLSAVIAGRDGRMAYWALTHPPGAPDFHHPDCFAAELPAPKRS